MKLFVAVLAVSVSLSSAVFAQSVDVDALLAEGKTALKGKTAKTGPEGDRMYRLRNVLDNAWAQQNDERRWLTLRDFDSEWWYARYLYSTLQPGMLVRTLRLVGSQASRKAQTPLLRPPFIERLNSDRAHRRRPDHEG